MAEKPNQPNINLPQRTITITGEHSARMCQNTVRVSRIEQRAIQIAMAPAAIRDSGRRAMERFAQAINHFEAELSQIERDIEASSRGGNGGKRRRNGEQQRGSEQRQNQGRDNNAAAGAASAKATAKPSAKPAAPAKGATEADQAKPAKPSSPAPAAEAPNDSASERVAPSKGSAPAKEPVASSAPAQVIEKSPTADPATVTEGATPANLEAL
ncbi:TPA: hypothetical protein L4R50_000023 [Pseudomonas aeruginosa]|nr:hypothetical protein [Pseudomonas aeruginosa]